MSDRNIRRVVFLDTLSLADELAAARAEPGVAPDRSELVREAMLVMSGVAKAKERIQDEMKHFRAKGSEHSAGTGLALYNDGVEHGLRDALRIFEEERLRAQPRGPTPAPPQPTATGCQKHRQRRRRDLCETCKALPPAASKPEDGRN